MLPHLPTLIIYVYYWLFCILFVYYYFSLGVLGNKFRHIFKWQICSSLLGFEFEQSISGINDWFAIIENDVEKSPRHAFYHRHFRIKKDCCQFDFVTISLPVKDTKS